MPDADYSLEDLRECLAAVGVRPGAVLVMYSSLMHLGRLRGSPIREIAARVLDTILDHLGPEGTLVAPAGFWDYMKRGLPYNVDTAPVAREHGALAREMVARPGCRRSLNPMFGVAALGKEAEILCAGRIPTDFGLLSPYERIVERNGQILMLGVPNHLNGFIRYIEHRFGVPYLYRKLFDGPVVKDGVPVTHPVTALVRYRGVTPRYNLDRFHSELLDTGKLRRRTMGAGVVQSVSCRDCLNDGVAFLAEDIHGFLIEPPSYVRGEIPFDIA